MKFSGAAGHVSIGSPRVAVILANDANTGFGGPIAAVTISHGQLMPGGAVWGGNRVNF